MTWQTTQSQWRIRELDTLSDEQKGSLAKLAEEASSTATNSVTGLDATEQNIANKVQAEGLRKFSWTCFRSCLLKDRTTLRWLLSR